MTNKIKSLITEAAGKELDLDNITNLISGRHLDSFSALILINVLEQEFGLEFSFDDDLIGSLESVKGIEKMIKGKIDNV